MQVKAIIVNMSARQLTDEEKIQSLKQLLCIVQDNVKRETLGQNGYVSKEQNALKSHLSNLLGRRATIEELSFFKV